MRLCERVIKLIGLIVSLAQMAKSRDPGPIFNSKIPVLFTYNPGIFFKMY